MTHYEALQRPDDGDYRVVGKPRWRDYLSTADKVLALIGLAQFLGCVGWMVLR